MKRTIVVILFFALLLGLWQVAAESGRWSPILFPSPWAVAEYVWNALLDGTLPEAVGVTLNRLLVGYAMGVLFGLPLGLLMSSSQTLKDTLGALALGLQTLPSVCWVPLALLWFGQTEKAMLFVVVPRYPEMERISLPPSSRTTTPTPLSPGFPREAPSVAA